MPDRFPVLIPAGLITALAGCMTAVFLVASPVSAVSGGASTSCSTSDADPCLISGAMSANVTAVEVQAATYVDPKSDAGFAVNDLTTAQVAISGTRYAVRLAPSEVPIADVSPTGLVDLTVTVGTTKGYYQTSASVRAAASRTVSARWADPLDVSGPVLSPTAASSTRSDSANAADLATRSGIGTDTSETSAVASATGVSIPSSDFTPAIAIPQHHCYWYRDKGTSDRWATIQTSYPWAGGESWVEYSTTVSSKYGVAVRLKGDWKASGTKSVDSGWGGTWTKSVHTRTYQTTVRYKKYKSTCTGSSKVVERMWKPSYETGIVQNGPAQRPNWHTKANCGHLPKGVDWYRTKSDGKAFGLVRGIDFDGVIGIDLSTERNYGKNSVLHYTAANNHTAICGNNGVPSRAGRIVERRL